jgi:sugar/nucleoside kinase (ribokinase family)
VNHVVSFGDLMVDVLARLPGPLALGSDTPAPIALYAGGAAANVAAWSVAAGASATFVGRAGDDALGRQAVEELVAAGVEARVEFDAHRATGTCIVLVDPSGERTMVPSAGANDAPVDVSLLPDTADWLCLSGYALLAPGPRPAARAALAAARERGWSIAVDAASAAPLAAVGTETFLGWLGEDVLLLANTDEAQLLSGFADPTAAAGALADRLGQAVVKRGADGAVWSDGAHTGAVPAVPAVVVDTTGAGDAFAAGYLAASGSAAQRLVRAVELAGRAVARVGGRPGAPLTR